MPVGNWDLEFLNHNSQRAYPLTEAGTKLDITGTVRIPDSFIVGLDFPIHAGLNVEPDKIFLRRLMISPTGYNVALAYDDDTSEPPLIARRNIAKSTHTENAIYDLDGEGDFYDTHGKISIGRLDEIDSLPPGEYIFAAAPGALDPDAVRPHIRGITGLIVNSGGDRSEPIVGDIELVAGRNIQLTADLTEGQTPKITISAVDGAGLQETCECGDAVSLPCISTINGIAPLPNGDFRMVGNECLQIQGIENGLLLEDTCSAPCCGCEALDAVRSQLDRFGDAALTLENFVSRLSGEVTKMSLVVLGSRLSDSGCASC